MIFFFLNEIMYDDMMNWTFGKQKNLLKSKTLFIDSYLGD